MLNLKGELVSQSVYDGALSRLYAITGSLVSIENYGSAANGRKFYLIHANKDRSHRGAMCSHPVSSSLKTKFLRWVAKYDILNKKEAVEAYLNKDVIGGFMITVNGDYVDVFNTYKDDGLVNDDDLAHYAEYVVFDGSKRNSAFSKKYPAIEE